jgi:hypothetical protein
MPILTVFHRGPDGVIRLSWASELLFMPTEPGQDPRHVGMVERCGPSWTSLPEGGRTRTSSSNTNAAGLKRRRILNKNFETARLRIGALSKPAQSCQRSQPWNRNGDSSCGASSSGQADCSPQTRAIL